MARVTESPPGMTSSPASSMETSSSVAPHRLYQGRITVMNRAAASTRKPTTATVPPTHPSQRNVRKMAAATMRRIANTIIMIIFCVRTDGLHPACTTGAFFGKVGADTRGERPDSSCYRPLAFRAGARWRRRLSTGGSPAKTTMAPTRAVSPKPSSIP